MFLPRESQGREAWWAAVYGVAQSGTRLKRLTAAAAGHGTLFQLVITHRHYLLSFGPLADKIGQTLFQCHCLFKSSKKKKKSLFEIYVYLFGYTGSQLQHTGSSIFAMACGICSCSTQTLSRGMWDLLLQSGIEPRAPALESRVLATGPPEKSPQNHFLSLL